MFFRKGRKEHDQMKNFEISLWILGKIDLMMAALRNK